MWWNEAGGGSGQWLAMGVMMLLFWAATISLLVWFIRRGRSTLWAGADHRTIDRADELLAERFVRGEIDEAQFTRGRTLLHSSTGRS